MHRLMILHAHCRPRPISAPQINADEELALEGEPVNHILIVLRGIFEFIKTEGNKEVAIHHT